MCCVVCSGQETGGESQAKLVPRLKPRSHDFTSVDVDGCSQEVASSDEEGASLLAGVSSGTGILEFSPERAGLDVTPADLDFEDTSASESRARKSSPAPVLSALAGQKRYELYARFVSLEVIGLYFHAPRFSIAER